MSRGPIVIIAAILFAAACGQSNPVLGDWELDRDETSRGAVLAAEAAELTTLRFESAAIASPGTEIPVSYVVEGDVVRVVRGDGQVLIGQVDGGGGHTGKRSPDLLLGLGSNRGESEVTLRFRLPGSGVRTERLKLQPGWHTVVLGAKGDGAGL